MSVERRYSKRLPVNFPALVRYREYRPFAGRACNLSLEGAYLEAQALNIPTGTLVDLEFLVHGRQWRLAALVVQLDPNGLGLMFRDSQPDLYQVFSQPASRTMRVATTPRSVKSGWAAKQ